MGKVNRQVSAQAYKLKAKAFFRTRISHEFIKNLSTAWDGLSRQ